MTRYCYVFGAAALPRPSSAEDHRDTFILGAYPSAIHVKWMPTGLRPISAVAVANEPETFWEGNDEANQILLWRQSIRWNPDWGEVQSAKRLNGSSGVWLRDNVLTPLHLNRSATWITDCLDIYHESKSAAARLDSREFRRFMEQHRVPDRELPHHPTESQIVEDAQRQRISSELRECRPARVVTLGNAALRVFNGLLEQPASIDKLSPTRSYGRPFSVRTSDGLSVEWIPLAHPAAPAPYQEAHVRWKDLIRRAA